MRLRPRKREQSPHPRGTYRQRLKQLLWTGKPLPKSRSEMIVLLGYKAGTGPDDAVPLELLEAIAAHDGLTLSELSRETGIAEQTASGVLMKLEDFTLSAGVVSGQEPSFPMDRRTRRHLLSLDDDTKPSEKRLSSG